MSILDVFDIVFRTNAKEVEKEVEGAAKAGEHLAHGLKHADEGAASLGHVEHAAHGLSHALDEVREHGVHMAEVLIEHAFEVYGAFQALFALERTVDNIFEQSEVSDKLGEMARQLGVNIEDLDALGNIAKRFGGSAEGFQQSLQGMERNLARLEATGKSRVLPFLAAFGIGAEAAKKPILELLPLLADGAEKMKAATGSNQQSSAYLRMIGADDGTIRMIQAGRHELEEMMERQRKLGLITEEDAKKAEEFNHMWDDTKQVFRSLAIDIDSGILPALGFVLDIVIDIVAYLREHENAVVGFFVALGIAIAATAYETGMLAAILGVLFSPVALLIGGVLLLGAAFGILYEDIQAFRHGHKSLIGELVNEYPMVAAAVRAIGVAWNWLWGVISDVVGWIVDRIKAIPEGFRQWEVILGTVFDAIGEFIATFLNVLTSTNEHVLDSAAVWSGAFKGFKAVVETAWVFIKGFFQTLGAIANFIADIFTDPMHAFQNLGRALMDISGMFGREFPKITAFFKPLHDAIMSIVTAFPTMSAAFAALANAMAPIGRTIMGIINGIGDAWRGVTGAVSRALGIAGPTAPTGAPGVSPNQTLPGIAPQINLQPPQIPTAPPMPANSNAPAAYLFPGAGGLGGGGGPHTNVNNEIRNTANVNAPINVNGAGDPGAVATEVQRALNSHINEAINNLATGAAR